MGPCLYMVHNSGYIAIPAEGLILGAHGLDYMECGEPLSGTCMYYLGLQYWAYRAPVPQNALSKLPK